MTLVEALSSLRWRGAAPNDLGGQWIPLIFIKSSFSEKMENKHSTQSIHIRIHVSRFIDVYYFNAYSIGESI